MINKIMELLGKINIKKIKITQEFKSCPPKGEKMWIKRAYFMINNKFEQPVVVDKDNVLVDGYTTYLIAKEKDMKYVPVVRLES